MGFTAPIRPDKAALKAMGLDGGFWWLLAIKKWEALY